MVKEKVPKNGDKGAKDPSGFSWPTYGKLALDILTLFSMLLGIVATFFNLFIAGFLVGLAAGLSFSREIYAFFRRIGHLYAAQGIIKSLIAIGTLIFFIIAIPTFAIAAIIGFGVMYLIYFLFSKR